jgi:branched-chain amino acid transport system substrate-binding protein
MTRKKPPKILRFCTFLCCAFLLPLFLFSVSCSRGGGKAERYNTPEAVRVTIGAAYPAAVLDADSYFRFGLELAVKEVNDAGGVLGKPLDLLIRDDRGDSRVAQQIAETFYDTGITAVIGHWSSDVCYFVEDIYEERKVIMISPSAVSTRLFEIEYQYIFRMVVNTLVYAEAMAEFAEQNGIRRPAVYYAEDTFGTDLARAVENELMKRQIPVVDRLTSITPSNVKEVIHRWRAFGCDALIAADILKGLEEPLTLIRSAGADFPILCAEDFDQSTFISEPAGYTDNLYAAVYGTEDMDGTFLANFRSTYGRDPNTFVVAGYEAVHLLADAMNAEGSIDSTAVARYLRSLQNYPSVMGRISYNPRTHEFDGRRMRLKPFISQAAR